MNIHILISTINKSIELIDDNIKKHKTLTIINQRPINLNRNIEHKRFGHINWLDFDEKGLSKSRNLAIDIARNNSDLIYLTDDDVTISDSFEEYILESFLQNPGYDILAFDIKGLKAKSKEKDIGFLTSMKLSSVQLIIKSELLNNKQIRFDENFGSGSDYSMGEENIFLVDALKNGARIKYIPKEIGQINESESTWFNGFTRKYFIDRGATFQRMFGNGSIIFSLLFSFRKRNQFESEFTCIEAFNLMNYGAKEYKQKRIN